MKTFASLFTGGDLAGEGARMAGLTTLWGVECDPDIAAVAELNGTLIYQHKVQDVDFRQLAPPDWLHMSPPCFPAGVRVLTTEGLVRIEDVQIGDYVLTHKGRYRCVTSTMRRESSTVRLKGNGHWGLEVTPDHPFLASWRQREYFPHKERKKGHWHQLRYTEPRWMDASLMKGRHWLSLTSYPALPIPKIKHQGQEKIRGQRFSFNEDLLWLIGAWVGDGWVRYAEGSDHQRNRGEVYICCGKGQRTSLEDKFKQAGVRYRCSEERTTFRFALSSRPLCRWLTENFGRYSHAKRIPSWLLGATASLRRAFFEGYIFADGHRTRERHGDLDVTTASTVSRDLAIGMRMLGLSLGYATFIHHNKNYPKDAIIEGRKINQRAPYALRFSRSERNSFLVGNYRAANVRSIEPASDTTTVYDITVDEDHSFLADGIIVHNCVNASVAKANAGEAPEDIEMAQGCIRAIQQFKSPFVSLENVWGYRNFESFQLIYAALMELGYQIRFWHLCAAHYGVAQTRKRLILVASLKGTPKRPEQTHSKNGHIGMFETMPRWIGWYEAIEDLIPTLPESQFAEWQLERLQGSMIVGEFDGAFLAAVQGEDSDKIDAPAPAITASHGSGKYRAFLMRSKNSQQEGSNQIRELDDPAMTLTASEKPRAFLVHNNDQRTMPIRNDDAPSSTVVAERGGKERAFIVDGKPANYVGELRIVDAEDPSPTATATATANQHPMRAWLSQGKVVALTVRALARLQSIPDSYILPDKNSLGRIVGNGVPCLLMKAIIEAQC